MDWLNIYIVIQVYSIYLIKAAQLPGKHIGKLYYSFDRANYVKQSLFWKLNFTLKDSLEEHNQFMIYWRLSLHAFSHLARQVSAHNPGTPRDVYTIIRILLRTLISLRFSNNYMVIYFCIRSLEITDEIYCYLTYSFHYELGSN